MVQKYMMAELMVSHIIGNRSNTCCEVEAVWPDWTIFESSWWQIIFQK